MSNIVHVSDSSFESEVLQSKVPVLVDFWAEWCGPCKSLSPILDDVSKEYEGKLKIVKLDVDKNNITSAAYAIKGVPTLLLFKDGHVVATKVGSLLKSQLSTFIDSSI